MPSEPRTLFVIINDNRLELSEPDTTLFHDQWFLEAKFCDQNMARRFIDMHVRGYYKEGKIHFYRCPTFIYDHQDIEVMETNLEKLLEKLEARDLIIPGQEIELIAGRGHNQQLVKTITV